MRRRDFLLQAGGLGMVAADWLHTGTATHHPSKARRVIQLFMNGGASQCDLFDHKPRLKELHGKTFDPGEGFRVEAPTSAPGKVVAPPVPLRQHGKCGRWV